MKIFASPEIFTLNWLVKSFFVSRIAATTVLLLLSLGQLSPSVAAESPLKAEAQAIPALKLPEALAAAGFKIFAGLVEQSSLAGKLRENRPFTCFAPTDEAFAAMPAEELTALKNESNPAKRLRWLESHFIADEVLKKSDLMNIRIMNTMAAKKILYVWVISGEIQINKTSPLVSPDILAANGVIHGISKLVVVENDTFAAK